MNQTTTLDFLYSRWGWTAVWLGIAGLSILFWLFTVAVGWHPWAEVASARAAGYAKEQCEFVNARAFFVQTANFWSNFAYLACGLFIWLRNRTFLGVAVGVTMCLIWFGSGLFHASLTEFGQLLDVVSIYVALGALLLYAVIQVIFDGGKFDPYRPGPGVYAALAVVMLFTAFALLKNTGICAELPFCQAIYDSDHFVPACAFLLFVLGVWGALKNRERAQIYSWPGILALAVWGAAALFKYADGSGKFLCGSESGLIFGRHSLIQGHALWHVCSAIGMLLVFEYFTTLTPNGKTLFPWVAQSNEAMAA